MVVSKEGEGFVRRIETRDLKDLPEGEVLIRVGYSSLNWKDCLSAMGNPGVTRRYPHTPGIDAAGMVVRSRSMHFGKGDRVLVTGYDLGMNTPGGFGEYIRVPGAWVVPLPEGLTRREAMAFGTAGFTAGLSVKRLVDHGVKPAFGAVLVTGATGGVGGLSVGILKRLGYTVAAVDGRRQSAFVYLKSIGADRVISVEEALRGSEKKMGEKRWAGVIDTVGGPLLESAIKTAQHRGVVACCGNLGAEAFASSIYPFILRGVTLCGIDSATCPMEERLEVWKRLAGPWKPESLQAVVTLVDGLGALDGEIERMVRGERTGRCVVHLP